MDMDLEYVSWMEIFRAPCHAWNPSLFEFISKPVRVYICVEDITRA